jgi:Holliday junction resolvase RusA-like endonuclease
VGFLAKFGGPVAIREPRIMPKKNERKPIDEALSLFTILGQPYSKANSRKVVSIKGKIRVIKSSKALKYSKQVKETLPIRHHLFQDDVFIAMKIYYQTRRPDLDESLILDLLQDSIYKNDRQVKGKHIIWGLDKENPRAVVCCGPLDRSNDIIETLHAFLKEECDAGDQGGESGDK